MHEVWSLLALSDSCRGVEYIQGKALHHLTEDPMAVRPLWLRYPCRTADTRGYPYGLLYLSVRIAETLAIGCD